MNTTKTNRSPWNIVAALSFALMTVCEIATVFYHFHSDIYEFPLLNLFLCFSALFVTVTLFLNRKDVICGAAFGAYALLKLIQMVVEFGRSGFVESYKWSFFVSFLSAALLALLAFLVIPEGSTRKLAKQLWFLPAIPTGIFVIIFVIIFAFTSAYLDVYLLTLTSLTVGAWLAFPEGTQASDDLQGEGGGFMQQNQNRTTNEYNGYYDMAFHVILLLLTCGIWNLIWIYRVTGYTNRAENEEYRDPTTKLLLCLFVPFYSIYWTYQTALRIDKMAAAEGIASDLGMLCLILSIFVPIVPPILMQNTLNKIATANGSAPIQQTTTGGASATQAPVVHRSTGNNMNRAEELKAFKELLDSGAITEEEYNKKKEEILGI